MAMLTVECLRCGQPWVTAHGSLRVIDSGECPRCGYVGWAPSRELTEPARRALRDRPLESRRLRSVA
jgi:hypothetical protein